MSGYDPYTSAFEGSLKGVQGLFPWLSRAEIIDPPHPYFDAALARQMVIYLMVNDFGIPKRRVVEMQGRSREAVNRALATLDARCAASTAFEYALASAGAAARGDGTTSNTITLALRRNSAGMTGRGAAPSASAAPARWYDETVQALRNGGHHG